MSKHSSFRHWLKEKWYEHLDESEEWTGKRPQYNDSEYFAKYKWWLNVNTFTKKDQGMWINEKRELDLIYQYLESPDLVDDFCDMWLNDLEAVIESDTKEEALQAANAILIWFNIDIRVVDVDWEFDDRCFLWKLK